MDGLNGIGTGKKQFQLTAQILRLTEQSKRTTMYKDWTGAAGIARDSQDTVRPAEAGRTFTTYSCLMPSAWICSLVTMEKP